MSLLPPGEYSFLYKCRRCGESERGPMTTGVNLVFMGMMRIVSGEQMVCDLGIPFGPLGMHHCADGGLGISDLQGADYTPS